MIPLTIMINYVFTLGEILDRSRIYYQMKKKQSFSDEHDIAEPMVSSKGFIQEDIKHISLFEPCKDLVVLGDQVLNEQLSIMSSRKEPT